MSEEKSPIELKKEENLCPVDGIELEYQGEFTEVQHFKEVDPVVKVEYKDIPNYVWKCPKCGLEVSITQ